MASQALLEAQLADLRARLEAAQARSNRLSNETPDYIPSPAAIQEAQLINRNVVKPLLLEIETTETQLSELLQVPQLDSVTISSNRPPYTIEDTTGIDEGPQIPNGFDPNEPLGNSDIQNYKPSTYEADPNVLLNNEPAGNSNIQHYTPTHVPSSYDNENVFDTRTDNGDNNANNIPGLQGPANETRAQKTIQDSSNANTLGDWRIRLSLAPGAKYLYAADNPGILAPLKKTDGVIFPYLPSIQVSYAAHYDQQELIHSNYKIYQYKSSGVDQVVITCDFTAQDTFEANYLLAVIHFFRSVTKMFYGQDQNPSPGVPPPLCYLSGMGDFQFDEHPLLISSFNYSLPNDVDYIRASNPTLQPGVNSTDYNNNTKGNSTVSQVRLNKLNPGAIVSRPEWRKKATNNTPTYVPTKIQLTITAYPVVTRNDISNNFSLREYATGALLQGRKNPGGGGIW
jgi:hypothetical protein